MTDQIAKPDHTVKAFDADLDNLRRMITALSDLTGKELKDAVDALVRQDSKLARQVIEHDLSVDAMQRDIESSAVVTLARRQPVADDLRFIIAVWETAIELKHVAHLAKNIANSVIAYGDKKTLPRPVSGLRRMARSATRRLHDVVNCLVLADAAKAQDLWGSDSEIDEMYSALCRELLTYMMGDANTNVSMINLLFCAKNIEQIGDHIKNIADAVHYMVVGRRLAGDVLRTSAA
jgi:phosphate transport system protein